ncbi:MAG TPA: hypothetical protein VNR87_04025 [Flavisolibacter sp.]|nr:hypothetical protein [Flavisolibacter sp.]
MKAATVNEIKQQLKVNNQAQLIELLVRLARFKKENKELLTYLLFEADDLDAFIKNVKDQLDEEFTSVQKGSLYYAKKTLRKILRIANKYIRYAGSETAEVEILVHYLARFRDLELALHKSTALGNLYKAQLKKLSGALDKMHEDLRYDYLKALRKLQDVRT